MPDGFHRFTTKRRNLVREGNLQWGKETPWEDVVESQENITVQGNRIRPQTLFAEWSYRREVTITERTGAPLTGFQARLDFDASNFDFTNAQATGADLRFATTEGEILPHYIEAWDAAAETGTIWVKIPRIPASSTTTINLFYGNPTAITESDASDTFLFHDAFADGFDTTVWSDVGTGPGSVSVSNGVLTITNTSDNKNSNVTVRGAQTNSFECSLGQTIEARSRSTKGRHNQFIGFSRQPIGFPHSSGVVSGGAYARLDKDPSSINLSMNDGTDTSGSATGNEDGDASYYSVWTLNRVSETEIELLRDGELSRSLTDDGVPAGDAPLYFGTDGWASAQIDVDWVRVREYADPAPTTTIGSENMN